MMTSQYLNGANRTDKTAEASNISKHALVHIRHLFHIQLISTLALDLLNKRFKITNLQPLHMGVNGETHTGSKLYHMYYYREKTLSCNDDDVCYTHKGLFKRNDKGDVIRDKD